MDGLVRESQSGVSVSESLGEVSAAGGGGGSCVNFVSFCFVGFWSSSGGGGDQKDLGRFYGGWPRVLR